MVQDKNKFSARKMETEELRIPSEAEMTLQKTQRQK